ncbi:response regulator transcription factor [Ignavigranum ruoffiae]|uniref:response regulator transcription factor n=1 Tax=Ignavigranum ruoffiae TaxID=89093 RepID=UPI002062FE77|nr:response regulator transcription factor [Ignavigranum ruoffiae]UPQ86077.1 response regulator transcription factor [Ignavigranum ruoffiae]
MNKSCQQRNETMHSQRRILIVEDDLNLLELYELTLIKAGYLTLTAQDANIALKMLEENTIHLILTDIMMPEIDGYHFVEAIKLSDPLMPIIMITAKSDLGDKRHGFQLGIDDYMVKPIDLEELVLRVQALLKRAYHDSDQALIVGQTQLIPQELSVKFLTDKIQLPQKEFLILYKLLSQPDQIFTRQQIMVDIWPDDMESDERTIDVHIRRLRSRLMPNPDFSIETVRGLGYKAVLL